MLVFSTTLEVRYWSYVDRRGPKECWPWTGCQEFYGHGAIYAGKEDGRPIRWKAHRVAWMLAHDGAPPPPELKVRHTCDNPPCQNPAHLLLGTQADNIRDMIERGRDRKRGRPGEQHHGVKITALQVAEIRARVAAGEMQKTLVPIYGISKAQVSRIVRGDRW